MHKEDCTKEECSHCCENCECCEEQQVGIVDEALAKAVSRKLLVFTAATCLLLWSSLDPDTWAMIACLLYTSPSPRDLSTSRMPSSA